MSYKRELMNKRGKFFKHDVAFDKKTSTFASQI